MASNINSFNARASERNHTPFVGGGQNMTKEDFRDNFWKGPELQWNDDDCAISGCHEE